MLDSRLAHHRGRVARVIPHNESKRRSIAFFRESGHIRGQPISQLQIKRGKTFFPFPLPSRPKNSFKAEEAQFRIRRSPKELNLVCATEKTKLDLLRSRLKRRLRRHLVPRSSVPTFRRRYPAQPIRTRVLAAIQPAGRQQHRPFSPHQPRVLFHQFEGDAATRRRLRRAIHA